MLVLNIAGGKFAPLPFNETENLLVPKFVLSVDTSYYTKIQAVEMEDNIITWSQNPDRLPTYGHLNEDAFAFMERTRITFDRVVIYRFLEHVTFTQVEYFIYLISTVLKKGGTVDVIVPNYEILAQMLINESAYDGLEEFNFQANNILLTTELLNEPSYPHASIWTPHRMEKFWELEGRFEVMSQDEAFKFDGREIYLRSLMKRI